jgi:hypothetical protein
MASGEGADWAARLRASLGAAASSQPAGDEPGVPPEAPPAESPRNATDAALPEELPGQPAQEAPGGLLDALRSPAASGLLANLAPAASPAGPEPENKPDPPRPSLLDALPQPDAAPQPAPAALAPPPAFTLLDMPAPPPPTPLRPAAAAPDFSLLDISALRAAESAATPAEPRPAPSSSPLLDALRPPGAEGGPAVPHAPMGGQQGAAPAPVEGRAPSPLLDALRSATPPAAEAAPPAAPRAPRPVDLPLPTADPAPRMPKPLPEREVRAVFQLLVGRPPTEAEFAGLGGFTARMALRAFVMAGPAFREEVLAPAVAAAGPFRTAALAGDLTVLDTLRASTEGEAGVVMDWFGLRTPLTIAPDLAGHAGAVLPRPDLDDPRAPVEEWIGLAGSVAGATGTWRALAVGAGRGDLLLAGAVAARRRGLALDLHASEAHPRGFADLLRHAEANGIDPSAGRFQQAVVGTDPAAPPPRGAAVQEWLAAATAWDWVRIAAPRAVVPLLRLSVPLLTEKVRVLSLVTQSRGEEAAAIRQLGRNGWRLVAELPVTLRRRRPEAAERTGVQVWRGPLV